MGVYFNKDKLIKTIVDLVQNSDTYEDEDFLNLLNEFNKKGILANY